MGLTSLKLHTQGDDSFIPVQEFLVGCYESADNFEELLRPDIQGISLAPSTGGSECGLKVVTYHIIPVGQRLKVERRIWDCFSESRDLREANDISCGGRFTYIGRHVKWLPQQVYYRIETEEGQGLADKFRSFIPWIQDTLNVQVQPADSSEQANLFLHLGVPPPPGCLERLGCTTYEDLGHKQQATTWIDAPDHYFGQVLKHELLHGLLPMGHLPEGNYLMSVRPADPSQTNELTPDETKLLALYTHPYLEDGMTMEQFSLYLVIEG